MWPALRQNPYEVVFQPLLDPSLVSLRPFTCFSALIGNVAMNRFIDSMCPIDRIEGSGEGGSTRTNRKTFYMTRAVALQCGCIMLGSAVVHDGNWRRGIRHLYRVISATDLHLLHVAPCTLTHISDCSEAARWIVPRISLDR